MEQCLFYLWLHWIAREKVLALHRRHLGAEKRAVTSELPPLPTDSSAAFVSAVRVQYITYQHITGTFRFEIRLAQLVFT